MMPRLPRFGAPRRFPSLFLSVLLTWSILLWTILPYDSSFRLMIRLKTHEVTSFFRLYFGSDDWLYEQPTRFPFDFDRDVVFIVKTGYGTQARVPAQLESMGLTNRHGNVVVIADFSDRISNSAGDEFEVLDVIAPLDQDDMLGPLKSSERLMKYKNMTAFIRAGIKNVAEQLSKSVGWELDALKFIPGLAVAYEKIPDKKWYLLLDDDTLVIKSSLSTILGHLDPAKPHYVGNAVGDYRGRFAHGGSAVILSGATMHKLLVENKHLLPVSYRDSLVETWGDKLLATTLIKIGIYLDENFSRHFNGEQPWLTRIFADRFCSPIASFHGLHDPEQMKQVGHILRGINRPVTWSLLWAIYKQPDLEALAKQPVYANHDYVGRLDEATITVDNVQNSKACLQICKGHSRTCLAWTWEENSKACHISPGVLVGEFAKGKQTGINAAFARKLVSQCPL